MSFIKQCLAALAALALSFSAVAATIDVGGAKIEDAVDLQGSKLQLNGAGVRYKAVFKVMRQACMWAKKSQRQKSFWQRLAPSVCQSRCYGKLTPMKWESHSPKDLKTICRKMKCLN